MTDSKERDIKERLSIIDKRIEDSMRFYSGWSGKARVQYHILNVAAIVASTAVPVIALLPALITGGTDASKTPWVLS